jgi:UDP-N-acetylglucosamine acyltransferase
VSTSAAQSGAEHGPASGIHPTAIVAAGARIPASCTVGPWCTIGPNVTLGEDCRLISHVVLGADEAGHLTLGRGNIIYPFACVGIAPQDLKYAGESTRCVIGDNNTVREYVTISRGTTGGGGVTTVGNGCLIMAYTHIGHDSHIGNGCILANSATLAGHVTVEDYAVVGALCPVHQYCRIGRYSYIGGGTTITQDVLPYSLTSIERNNHAYGLNKVGLERRGFTPAQLKQLRHAYHLLQASRLNTTDALAAIRATLAESTEPETTEHVRYLADFIANSQRGIIK